MADEPVSKDVRGVRGARTAAKWGWVGAKQGYKVSKKATSMARTSATWAAQTMYGAKKYRRDADQVNERLSDAFQRIEAVIAGKDAQIGLLQAEIERLRSVAR